MPKVIPEIQAGSGTTDVNGDASVTFPSPYASTPKVFLQGVDAAAKGIVLDVVSKSATGFAVKARKVTGLPTGSALQGMHYYTASAVTGIPTATGGASAYSHTHGIGAPSTGTFVTGGSDPGHTHVALTMDAGVSASPTFVGFHSVRTADGTFRVAIWDTGLRSATTFTTSSSTTGITLYTASAVTGIPTATGSGGVDHTHGIAAATTGTFVTSLTILPEDWLTVIVGDAPVLAVDFDWLSILA